MNGKDYNQNILYRLDMSTLIWDVVNTRYTNSKADQPG